MRWSTQSHPGNKEDADQFFNRCLTNPHRLDDAEFEDPEGAARRVDEPQAGNHFARVGRALPMQVRPCVSRSTALAPGPDPSAKSDAGPDRWGACSDRIPLPPILLGQCFVAEQPGFRSDSTHKTCCQPSSCGLSHTARRTPARRTEVRFGRHFHPSARQLRPDCSDPVRIRASTGCSP